MIYAASVSSDLLRICLRGGGISDFSLDMVGNGDLLGFLDTLQSVEFTQNGAEERKRGRGRRRRRRRRQ